MTVKQIFATGVDTGDKVALTLKEPDWYARHEGHKPRKETLTLYFRGWRILCGQGVTNANAELVPVFVYPTKKDGTMGRRHYGLQDEEIPAWTENIVSLKIISKSPSNV